MAGKQLLELVPSAAIGIGIGVGLGTWINHILDKREEAYLEDLRELRRSITSTSDNAAATALPAEGEGELLSILSTSVEILVYGGIVFGLSYMIKVDGRRRRRRRRRGGEGNNVKKTKID